MASEEFAIGEGGLTKDGYKALHKRARTSMYVRSAISIAVIVAVCIASYLFREEIGEIVFLTISAAAVLLIVYRLIAPAVYYARYRYRIGEDRIDIRRGIIFISHEIVPVERIHQLEVFRGPIDTMFGLADVKITTAGGVAAIQHLEKHVAEEVADSLNAYVTKILKERE